MLLGYISDPYRKPCLKNENNYEKYSIFSFISYLIFSANGEPFCKIEPFETNLIFVLQNIITKSYCDADIVVAQICSGNA